MEAGVWALPLGHCDEDVINIMCEQMKKISHVGYKYNHGIVEKCADKLLEINQMKGKCVFLSSGSEAVDHGFHYAQSHQNDPLGAGVAYEVLIKIERCNLLKNARKMGDYFVRKYQELSEEVPVIAEIRARGLLLCMELKYDVTEEQMAQLDRALFAAGIIAGVKTKERVIRTYCPLIVDSHMIDEYMTALRKCFFDQKLV